MKLNIAENKRKYSDAALLILMLICILVVYSHRDELFMTLQYEFKTVSAAFYGYQGERYVVDQGKKVINIIDPAGKLVKQLKGGEYDRFYYAQSVAADKDGVIYIADEAYNDEGSQEYRIVCLENGKYKVLFTTEGMRIYEIQEYEGTVFFLAQEETGLALYRVSAGGEIALLRRFYTGDVLNSASVDMSTGVVAIAARRGSIRIQRGENEDWTTIKKDSVHMMPQDISARGGRVFYSELYGERICCFEEETPDEIKTIYWEDGLKLHTLNAAEDGCGVLGSDFVSYYDIGYDEGRIGEIKYEANVVYEDLWKTVCLWIMLVISVLILLWMLRSVPGWLISTLHNEAVLRMVVVVVAVVSVSGFIGWSLLTGMYEKEDMEDISNMKLFTDLTVGRIDTSYLDNIEWETDYQSSSYMKLRETMDELMAEAYSEGKDYYYVFYGVKNDKLRYLMNYYDSITCGEPFGRMDDTYYMEVFNNGTSYALKSQDADGLWLYILEPVKNEESETIAVLEVGTDLSYRTLEQKSRTRDTLLDVFCSSAVMMMLIVEALFLMNFFDRRRNEKTMNTVKSDVTHMLPLRTIVLLSYTSSTLQDAFIITLSSKLYKDNLPLSNSVASGLPLSAELLMMAAFAVVGGRMIGKVGSRKTLFVGISVEIAGFVCCAVMGSYMGLLVGNTLVGIGMGLINVTCNTIAAMGETMESTAEAFADVMAGTLSGLTIGAGLASLLYPLGGSRLSYTVAACFMVPVIFLVYGSQNINTSGSEEQKEESNIGFIKFFFNLRVLGFFALILVPFMISVSYREYFLPMYVMENGIGENRVGQMYLICGLLVLYAGPIISRNVIKRFGTFWSIIIASIAMGANMMMFVIHPSVTVAFAGMLILSTITSFAYTCQYTFFEQLPDSLMYGDGRSMGVYSIFENLGQTIGPMVYGAILGFGYRYGLGIMGAALFILTMIYIVAMKFNGQSRFFR